MRNHSFTLFLRGADVLDDAPLDALYEAGCGDALFGERDGAQYAAFDREARSFGAALISAIEQLTSAIPGLRVVRIEPDETVTMAAIAERCGLSREGVRLMATERRGPGGFPPPVAYADKRTRLWHWPDVARWMQEHGKGNARIDTDAAGLVAAMNAALELREDLQALSENDAQRVISVLEGEAIFSVTKRALPARAPRPPGTASPHRG